MKVKENCNFDVLFFLFRDIDDTVMIGWKHGTMTLRAIADETTKHIENLVSKQKKPSKKKRIMYQGREPNLPNMNSRPPRFSKGGLLPPPKIVPAYVRKQIITLFKGYRCGIALENLDDAFIRQFGNRINFSHYGFKSWEEFLNSLKDVISIKEMPNGDWRLLPVEGLYDSNLDKSRKHKAISADEHQPDVGIQNTSPNQETARTRRPSKGRGRVTYLSNSKFLCSKFANNHLNDAQMMNCRKMIKNIVRKRKKCWPPTIFIFPTMY